MPEDPAITSTHRPSATGKKIETALIHHQSGRLSEAEAIYRQVLADDPANFDALHLLGVIANQAGNSGQAAELIGLALLQQPQHPFALNNMGLALQAQGKPDEAISCYRKAISVKPDFADAHFNLGNLLQTQNKPDEAVGSYHRALALHPDDADALNNLGKALHSLRKLDEAVDSYRKAISIRPDYAEALNNLGVTLQGQGKMDEAISNLNKALSCKANYAEAHMNLGNALQTQGRFDEALTSYRRVLLFKPDMAEAYVAMGNTFREQDKLDQAIANYREALSIKPDYAEAHNNLGVALKELDKLDEATASYHQALLLKPGDTKVYSNLLYLHAFTRNISPEAECALASNWECAPLNESERTAARNRALAFPCPPRAGRKLRLGIVSAELGQHAVAEFLEPLLEQLDRNRFHVTLYPTATRAESRADRLRKLADEYKSLLGLPDSKAAELIRSDHIDVLIDTTGHMKNCRLGIFAHRAAPVQCEYIGYHGTTGLTEMDWFIADEALLPAACDAHFREKIWRLPRLWISYRGDTSLPASNWKPDADGTVWLGSFNNLTKVREQTLALWARVMNALPESKLLLKDNKAADPSVQERIRRELARYGIGSERVEFAAWTSGWSSHMALYDRLDIALDTIPLNSGTTAFDALWMGVPLVALEGNWMGGRLTGAMLNALGKPEWVARDEDEYVAIVAALARDVAGRKKLRAAQRALMANSPLCDAKGLASALENAFEAMFDQWLDKQNAATSPDDITA